MLPERQLCPAQVQPAGRVVRLELDDLPIKWDCLRIAAVHEVGVPCRQVHGDVVALLEYLIDQLLGALELVARERGASKQHARLYCTRILLSQALQFLLCTCDVAARELEFSQRQPRLGVSWRMLEQRTHRFARPIERTLAPFQSS